MPSEACIFLSKNRRVSCNGVLVDLTQSEFRILETFLSNEGRVFHADGIDRKGQGSRVAVTPLTIDNHILELRRKLGEPFDEWIVTVRGTGYKLMSK